MRTAASVIIPCYNYGHVVNAAICSALAQTRPDIEVLLVDYGSDDNTPIVASRLTNDGRFRYIRCERGTLGYARNVGLDAASGQYVQFLDADDVIYPVKIERQTQVLDKTPGAMGCHSDFCCVSGADQRLLKKYASPELGAMSFLEALLLRWERGFSIPCHCFLHRREALSETYFDEALPNHEDWLFYITLASHGYTSVFVPEVLCEYRVYSGSMARQPKTLVHRGYTEALTKAMTISEVTAELVKQRYSLDAAEAR